MKRLPPPPTRAARPKSRSRKGRVFPPPCRSARVYIYIDPSKVHRFRYFLEARDNLGLMTVVDRWRAALLIRFSPQQERDMREFLEDVREILYFDGPFSPAVHS
jgi:hypothetical protein